MSMPETESEFALESDETPARVDEATGERGETPEEPAKQEPGGPEQGEKPKGEPNPWNDPRLPWGAGKPRLADILCWAGIVLSGIFLWATLPLRTSLVGTHPVWSELIAGGTESIVSAAAFARIGHGTLAVALLAAFPGLLKFDLLYWWAGRLWGERIIVLLTGRSKRAMKYMARVQRSGRKVTWPAVVVSYFVPIPSGIIYAVAGWTEMGLVTFLILDALGVLLWAGMLCGLGYALGHHGVVIAKNITHYGLWVAIGLMVLMVAYQVRIQRSLMREVATAPAASSDSGAGEPLPL
jgi:membrane protein DedA with SNARE-associated domain